jgi:hypothetical protein
MNLLQVLASVDVSGIELTALVDSVGIEAGGNITIPVFEDPMTMSLGDISLIISRRRICNR